MTSTFWLVELFCLLCCIVVRADDVGETLVTSPEASPDVAQDEVREAPLPSEAEVRKMRVKQLKALLMERGIECAGCVEKPHLVKRVLETLHMPILPKEEPKRPQGSPSEFDVEKIMEMFKAKNKANSKVEEDLLRTLRAQGIDTSNIHFSGASDWDPEMLKKRKEEL